jgi:hypothetical protein
VRAAARCADQQAHAAPLPPPPPPRARAACAALSPAGYVCFLPPSAVVYEYTLHHFGPQYVMQNDLLAVPAGPGRSVAYTLGTSSAPVVTNGDIVAAALRAPGQLPKMLVRCVLSVCVSVRVSERVSV